jgi:cell division protease FtsH
MVPSDHDTGSATEGHVNGHSDNEEQNFRKSDPGLRRFLLLLPLLLLVLVLWYVVSTLGVPPTPHISYTEFRNQLDRGNVKWISVEGEHIEGEFKKTIVLQNAADPEVTHVTFKTYLPSFGDQELFSRLYQENVEIMTEPESGGSWLAMLLLASPLLLLILFGYLQYRRMGGAAKGGAFSVGKSKAKLFRKDEIKITFDNVAGAEGAKQELHEIIAFLKEPGRIRSLGAGVPRGVLLVGPPGTGKTLLARAVAGEAGVPFFSITGSDFVEMYVGVGAARVRNLFEDAKKNAPCIIFIDEIDSIGRRRGAGLGGGNDEREQTLNQLLAELDGFEHTENVIVMTATNRPDILDPALMRPGRFDRRVAVDLPSTRGRLEILQLYAKNKPLAEDIDLEKLARGTPGFSGADLQNLLNEAALLTARTDRLVISKADVENARDKILLGLVRHSLALTREERLLIAYHEGGHAIVAAVLPNADPVHKVSIIPRSRSMGVTQQLPEREKFIYDLEYMLDRLAVMMGGRASEELIFETFTNGVGNDLVQATRLARKMVLEWGMSERFMHMALGGDAQEAFLGEDLAKGREYSEQTAREVDEEVRSILDKAYHRARRTLEERREELDRLVDLLLEHEEIDGHQVLKLTGNS